MAYVAVVWNEVSCGRRSWPVILDYHNDGYLPNSPRRFDTQSASGDVADEFDPAPASPECDIVIEDFDDERDWQSASDDGSDESKKKKEKYGKKAKKGIWKRIRGLFRRFRY